MQKNLFQRSRAGGFLAVLAALVVLAGIGYFGYMKLIEWHEEGVEEAVAEKDKKLSELRDKISRVKQKVETGKQEAGAGEKSASERIGEVFGGEDREKAGEKLAAREAPECYKLEKRIDSFFRYLDSKGFVDAASVKAKSSREAFEQMLADLSGNPPRIVSETQDIITLMHNQAHFFRVLNRERIELIKYILSMDSGVLEHAMLNFYDYYVTKGGCGEDSGPEPGLETIYKYSAFFLDTFAGKSYLLRRQSIIRCLARYYSVLVLDRANREMLNSFGIDIRPHLERAADEVKSRDDLIYKDLYIKKLNELKDKYMEAG